MIYYSASTHGFYVRDVHGNNIPEDAVAITHDEHERLLAGQDRGMVIVADASGRPDIIERPPLTNEELAVLVRAQRDQLLAELDTVVSNPLRWAAFTQQQQQKYSAYRQALLDVPQQPGFPTNVVWPDKP